MQPNNCEKRLGNGQYCKRPRQFKVVEGISKEVCDKHLADVVAFFAGDPFNTTNSATVSLIVLDPI